MSQLFQKSKDIRYTKLYFTIQFTEDTMLPKQKVSAIRGGIGEMLLRANCVNANPAILNRSVLCRGSCTPSMRKSHPL